MSQDGDDASLGQRALGTATRGHFGHEDPEMNAIGWGLFLGLVILLVPLLPFLAIIWLITKALGWGERRAGGT